MAAAVQALAWAPKNIKVYSNAYSFGSYISQALILRGKLGRLLPVGPAVLRRLNGRILVVLLRLLATSPKLLDLSPSLRTQMAEFHEDVRLIRQVLDHHHFGTFGQRSVVGNLKWEVTPADHSNRATSFVPNPLSFGPR